MSFREKSAWVTLITLIVLTIVFVLHLPYPYTLAPEPNPFLFFVLLLSVGTFIAIEIVAHIAIAVWSPRDALAPKDERERLIALKSTAFSAYVYSISSLGTVFAAVHLGANEIGLVYLLMFCFVLAEIVNYAVRVFLYRRGS